MLSPWVMMMPPMMRVDMPQEVCMGYFCLLSLSVKVMSNCFAKPSPKKWLVPDWRAFLSCIMHSMV